jgi:hypothetical protein
MPRDDGHSPSARSLDDLIAEQFYAWEPRGRGWVVWDDPVDPEPPFRPFHWRPMFPVTAPDDGRKHTAVSGAIEWFSNLVMGKQKPEVVEVIEEEEQPPRPWVEPDRIVELQFRLPEEASFSLDTAEQFLLSLSLCHDQLAFEVIGLADAIVIQIACNEKDEPGIRQQLEAFFSDATFEEVEDFLSEEWESLNDDSAVIAEFGLEKEFMLPITEGTDMAVDPLVGITGALAGVQDDEIALVQILFKPVRHAWGESVLRSVTFADGSDLFVGAKPFVSLAREKVAHPLYAVILRVAVKSRNERRSLDLARRVTGSLSPLSAPNGNSFIPLDNKEYDPDDHISDVGLRRCRRSGMILSSRELATLVHLPSDDVRSSKLQRDTGQTKSAPQPLSAGALVLGQNRHAGKTTEVTLSPDQRVRHMHAIGASGTGKSNFLLNMIIQDINHGQGVGVIDPHGDLIDAIIDRIPKSRIQDVVLLDPADEAYPMGLNILAAHSEAEKNLLASDLVGIFRRLSVSNWGDQMNSVLANAVLAILEHPEGGTLMDMRRLLVEKPFREEYLRSVQDEQVVYYWRKEFPLLTGRPQAPVLTRLDAFLRPKPIRYMVCQKENRLDFADIMDNRKIFLARLSHGAFGEENAHLLGAFMVAKFNQTAMSRQQTSEAKRQPFWLYVDEFQHFATPSMAALLSSVRKYKLGLVLAHQELHQLESKHPEVASAVLSNAYTRVCFRVGDQDARKLENGFSSFDAKRLQNLGVGEAICRIERADHDFNLAVPMVPRPDDDSIRDEVIEHSRKTYATPRATVEDYLRKAAEGREDDEPVKRGKAPKAPTTPENEQTTPKPPPPQPIDKPVIVPDPPKAPDASAEGQQSATPNQDQSPEVSSPASNEAGPEVDEAKIAEIVAKQKAKRAMPKPAPKVPAEEMQAGRGGQDHKYLQQMIKQWGDGMGYRSTIEKAILGGEGSIDVALEKGDLSIACMVSVTTSDQWELAGVRKCLAAGCTCVVMLAGEPKHLSKLKRGIEGELTSEEKPKVHFTDLQGLFKIVQELDIKTLEQEKTVRGYKVRTRARKADAQESQEHSEMISGMVAKSIRRVQGSGKKRKS